LASCMMNLIICESCLRTSASESAMMSGVGRWMGARGRSRSRSRSLTSSCVCKRAHKREREKRRCEWDAANKQQRKSSTRTRSRFRSRSPSGAATAAAARPGVLHPITQGFSRFSGGKYKKPSDFLVRLVCLLRSLVGYCSGEIRVSFYRSGERIERGA